MTRSKLFPNNLISIFILAAISFISAAEISAQCEGTYFKTTGRTITDPQTYIYDFEIRSKTGDLTGDGKIDLVATNINSPINFNKLFIYPGDGAGGFGARTVINLPGVLFREYSYYLEDFNRDGKTDLIVQYSTNVLVYLNNGAGAFSPLTATALSSGEQVENFADVNHDARLDLITTFASATYYRLANAEGTFSARIQIPSPNYSGRHEGDFDGDGDVDFAALNNSGATSALVIVANQGNGTFIVSNPLISLDSGGFFIETVADFNNDGKPDILLTGDSVTPKMTVVLNQGNNNFTKTTYNLDPTVNTFFINHGDFNGDGFTDLIATKSPNGPGYLTALNNGAGAFTLRYYPFGLYLNETPVGDLNGDGKTDLIRIHNASQNSGQIRPSIFNETHFTVKTSRCTNFGQTKIVDFDSDRKTNRTLWRASDGRWRYQYDNSPYFQNTFTTTFFWGSSNDLPVPGDYDGDGATDHAVFRPSEGAWYIRNSSNNSTTAIAFGLSTDKPVPADYNGDGRTDIAVYRPQNGTWYFLTSGTNQFSARQFGIAEDIPLPEDYDGDERADIAVFRPSQGNWHILRSSNNSFYTVNWGLGTDDPHPADYDGDGKADLAVRRKSNNVWYILRSYNNQFGALQYGISEDIAQIGDWDGNGIMDIGVYRPSSRLWYSTGAVSGAPGALFGEPNEIPIASILR